MQSEAAYVRGARTTSRRLLMLGSQPGAGSNVQSSDSPMSMHASGVGLLSHMTSNVALPFDSTKPAYGSNGGAPVHTAGYVYKGHEEAPMPNPAYDKAYTAPHIGPYRGPDIGDGTAYSTASPGTVVPPSSLLETWRRVLRREKNIYPVPQVPTQVVSHPGAYSVHPATILPSRPGNGYASFAGAISPTEPSPESVGGASAPGSSSSSSALGSLASVGAGSSSKSSKEGAVAPIIAQVPSQTPYVVAPGSTSAGAFIEENRELPKPAWIRSPDNKNRFGAGIPLTPVNNVLPGANHVPVPTLPQATEDTKQGTATVFARSSPLTYKDPHPPPVQGPEWSSPTSLHNPMYLQNNPLPRAPEQNKVPHYSMPQN